MGSQSDGYVSVLQKAIRQKASVSGDSERDLPAEEKKIDIVCRCEAYGVRHRTNKDLCPDRNKAVRIGSKVIVIQTISL
jgi:hypothetical protein